MLFDVIECAFLVFVAEANAVHGRIVFISFRPISLLVGVFA